MSEFPLLLTTVARTLTGRRIGMLGLLARIGSFEPALIETSDEDLRKASLSLKYRARSGESLDRLLPEAFALVREAARRTLDMRHYDVQLLGGSAMHRGSIVEMQTGEGKTLTATLPMYLAALRGKGAHLATANDYLARRDADWMRPVYAALGLSVGVIDAPMPRQQRRQAYLCDVTYGTAKEFGFDFLRDRLLSGNDEQGESVGGLFVKTSSSSGGPVQREHHFMLVDEADSLLIDEAKTPLIVSSLPGDSAETAAELYRWAATVPAQLDEQIHYQYDPQRRAATLTALGRRRVRELPHPPALAEVGMLELYEHVERAVGVQRDMLRDRHYVVRDGEVVIVDEFTGRLAEGRRWRAGIHQAIEAKEGLEVSVETGDAARITAQDFFRRYERLAGMTGTIAGSGRELRKIYGADCFSVPTNRPARRTHLPDLVFGDAETKWEAIVEEVLSVHVTGRPVLIGTRSIDKSEHFSRLLDQVGVEHQVLNARHLAAEAEIVAGAGKRGRVTVATNMAGRGTDIRLDDEVREIGGLHVVLTELHESRRIDRQLIGRCGRQGDPGSYRYFMALDDDILAAGLGQRRAERLRRLGRRAAGSIEHRCQLLRNAQRRVERKHFRQRRLLLYIERERRQMQDQMGQDPFLDTPS